MKEFKLVAVPYAANGYPVGRHSDELVAKVRAAHTLRGLGRFKLAKEFGVSPNTVLCWITGRRRKGPAVRIKMKRVPV